MGKAEQWIVFTGRLLLGLSFLGAGMTKIGMWDKMIAYLASTPLKETVGAQMIPTVLTAMVMLEVIGGFMMCLGYKTRLAAGMLAIPVLISLSFLHQFWNLKGPAFTKGYFQFLQDAKILGGILFVMCFGPGKYSLDKG